MKKNAWLFILVILVMSLLRKINILEVPMVIVLGFSLAYIIVLIYTLVKMKNLKNKYFKLLIYILFLTCLTVAIFLVIKNIYPQLLDKIALIITLLLASEIISVIVISLLSINNSNKHL